MSAKLDPEVCRRIAAESAEDDGRMLQPNWCTLKNSGPHGRRYFPSLLTHEPQTSHDRLVINDSATGQPCTMEMCDALADGMARTRNNLPAIAAQLTAAAEMGTRVEEIEDAMCTAIDALTVGIPAGEVIDRLQVVLDDVDRKPARPALTADGVRAVVREAALYVLGPKTADGIPVDMIAHRVAEKLAGRSLAASDPAPIPVVGIGPADTVVILEALDLWDRYLTAPHADIARIRAALTGTAPS